MHAQVDRYVGVNICQFLLDKCLEIIINSHRQNCSQLHTTKFHYYLQCCSRTHYTFSKRVPVIHESRHVTAAVLITLCGFCYSTLHHLNHCQLSKHNTRKCLNDLEVTTVTLAHERKTIKSDISHIAAATRMTITNKRHRQEHKSAGCQQWDTSCELTHRQCHFS